MPRLKSCPYCGRIHPTDYNCGKRPVFKRDTDAVAFRNTYAWQRKRAEIMERDKHLCRMSLYNSKLVYNDLSVHHIEPLDERYDLRLEDSNLITLNGVWHELAEAGKISRELLHKLAQTPPALPDGIVEDAPHRRYTSDQEVFPK